MSQKNQLLSSKGSKSELIKGKRDFARLSDSEKMDYFALFDETTNDSVLINKDWIIDNPETVSIIDNGEISIRTYSHSIRVNDKIMVDSILIATKKRFPRPFRPTKYQNSEEKKGRTSSERERINTILEVDSFRIIESNEISLSGIPKKYMELCFNREFRNEDVCVMFYFEFQSGEKWKVSSGKISRNDINHGKCLYEEITDNSDRLGHSNEDQRIKKHKLKEDNIKSIKVEIYDRCWNNNHEKEYPKLISSKEIEIKASH